MFDPYHKWLAIPTDQRPPSLYQLLGVSPAEKDPEVIAEAAVRQCSHVRVYQTGPRARQCIRLLNEIAQARSTLLDPDRRQEYDESIRDLAAEEGGRPRSAAPEQSPSAEGDTPTVDRVRELGPQPVYSWEPLFGSGGAFCLTPSFVAYLLLLLLGGLLGFWVGWH
jgi:hypothetical protein